MGGKDARKEVLIVDLEAFVLQDRLLRKIEKAINNEWNHERLDPYCRHDNGGPGTRPGRVDQNAAHTTFVRNTVIAADTPSNTSEYGIPLVLGYNLLEKIPHLATVSYAFCKRFPEELITELNKALNNRRVDPSVIFIDGTHITKPSQAKRSTERNRCRRRQKYLRDSSVKKRMRSGKDWENPIEDDDDNDYIPPSDVETAEKTESTPDPDSGMFVKGEHGRQFAYEAHTVWDQRICAWHRGNSR